MASDDVNHTGFEDMAPLKGEKARLALNALSHARDWGDELSRLVPREEAERLATLWKDVQDVTAFQGEVVKPFLEALASQTTDGFEWSQDAGALEAGRLFLSNHRDIVLDPSFINMVLLGEGHRATEIGIGSNLLKSPWVDALVRLNRCFVVERSGSARERYAHSLRTATYIQHVVAQGQPVWLAHREGRAKDGMDTTAPALVRTLSKGGDEDTWNDLAVSPTSLSYEWDPCDAMKIHELLSVEMGGSYDKEVGEDERSMWMGLAGGKGRVHFHFGAPLAWQTGPQGEKQERWMAQKMDERLMDGMKLWPNQRLCAEWLGLSSEIASQAPKATELERAAWQSRLEEVTQAMKEKGWSEEQASRMWCKVMSAPLVHRHGLLHQG